jgi:hypothetical protein
MSKLAIEDLDFCNELPNSQNIRGSDNTNKGLWDWDVDFNFDFDHNGIAGWSQGFLSGYGIAIGGLIITPNNPTPPTPR